MLNLKSANLKSNLLAALDGAAKTSFLTIFSMMVPTAFSMIIFWTVFDAPVWFDGDVYAASDSLFGFYVWCSLGYLVSMILAIVGAVLVEEINLATKVICVIMFIMIVDNLIMALDALDLMTWSALEDFDSTLQVMCGASFLMIGVLCLTMKLWRYAFPSYGYPYGS